jgi:hypothetical protein
VKVTAPPIKTMEVRNSWGFTIQYLVFSLTKQGFEYIRRNLKKQTRLEASGGKKKMSETSKGPEHCGETYHPQKKVRPYYTRANGFTLASD